MSKKKAHAHFVFGLEICDSQKKCLGLVILLWELPFVAGVFDESLFNSHARLISTNNRTYNPPSWNLESCRDTGSALQKNVINKGFPHNNLSKLLRNEGLVKKITSEHTLLVY